MRACVRACVCVCVCVCVCGVCVFALRARACVYVSTLGGDRCLMMNLCKLIPYALICTQLCVQDNLWYEMYAPRTHLTKGDLRPHYYW